MIQIPCLNEASTLPATLERAYDRAAGTSRR